MKSYHFIKTKIIGFLHIPMQILWAFSIEQIVKIVWNKRKTLMIVIRMALMSASRRKYPGSR